MPFIAVGTFLTLAAVGLLVGWNLAGDTPEAASRQSPTPSPAHPDPGGKVACDGVETAREHKAWNDHGLVKYIADAAKTSTNNSISVTGTLLERRLGYASAAMGQPDQPEMDQLLRSTMADMEEQCQRAGLL